MLIGNTVLGGATFSTLAKPSNDDVVLWHKWLGHLSECSVVELHK